MNKTENQSTEDGPAETLAVAAGSARDATALMMTRRILSGRSDLCWSPGARRVMRAHDIAKLVAEAFDAGVREAQGSSQQPLIEALRRVERETRDYERYSKLGIIHRMAQEGLNASSPNNAAQPTAPAAPAHSNFSE